MYSMIKNLNLGNLSGLPCIPEFYLRCLLGFIIQISKTLAHMHKHDLIHGKFDLTRVLVKGTTLEKE